MDGGLGLRTAFEDVYLKSNYFDRNEKWLTMMVMEMVMMTCDDFDDDDW